MANLVRRGMLASLLLMVGCGLASAEEGKRLPKIGVLYSTNPGIAKPADDAFRDGLRELGHIDGKNIIFLTRYAQGDYSQFPRLLHELIAEDVDVLFVSISAVQAAMQATRTIPIVCAVMSDPVRDGLVASFAHPGGNLTGGSSLGPDADTKRLQFAKEVVLGLKRVGLLYEATNPQYEAGAVANRALADGLGLSLHTYGVHNLEEIRRTFARLEKDRIQALIMWDTPLMLLHRQTIMDLASRKIPVIGQGPDLAHGGALITYSAAGLEMWKQAAIYVDKILKGTKPGDLPIYQPTKFTLRVNLKAAKELGITIPEAILLQADEVIR